jgi:hypothetical protein
LRRAQTSAAGAARAIQRKSCYFNKLHVASNALAGLARIALSSRQFARNFITNFKYRSYDMKKFALAVLVIAFGAMLVAGCPEENKAKGGNTPAPANTTTNAE